MGLFNFFNEKKRTAFTITEADHQWVEENFRWLFSVYDTLPENQGQFMMGPEYFPRTFSTPEATFDVHNYLLDCCELLDLDATKIKIEYQEDIRDLAFVPWEMKEEPTDSYVISTPLGHTVLLANDLKRFPKGSVYHLSKRLLQIRMYENKWRFYSTNDSEIFLVLSSIFFGFGLIMIQTLSEQGIDYLAGWEHRWSRSPEVPEVLMIYALAFFSTVWKSADQSWTQKLSSSLKKQYDQALLFIAENPSPLTDPNEITIIRLEWEANTYLQKQDFQKYIQRMEEALSLSNDTLSRSIFINNIGYAFILMKEYEKSLPYFKNAILADRTFGTAFVNWGLAELRMGNAEEGLAFTHSGIETENFNSHYCDRNIALYHILKNEPEEAEKAFQLAFSFGVEPVDGLEVDYYRFLKKFSRPFPNFAELLRPAIERGELDAIAIYSELNLKP